MKTQRRKDAKQKPNTRAEQHYWQSIRAPAVGTGDSSNLACYPVFMKGEFRIGEASGAAWVRRFGKQAVPRTAGRNSKRAATNPAENLESGGG
jgi:hypothetical protein